MPTVTITEKGCRGCSMCEDVCPVDVFDYDEGTHLATATRPDDCIGCLSCVYVCPSQCIEVADVELLPAYHRIEENVALVERFLQTKAATTELTQQDCETALKDVSVRLDALAQAVTETMGRGQRAVGRKAGTLAAAHLPEMYEEASLEDVLKRMQQRFRDSFDFEFELAGENVNLTFTPCGLHRVVTEMGETPGEAVLCKLFHEYWAGLLSSFAGARYRCDMPEVGEHCKMVLEP